jgi:hypothetical protein
MLFLMKKYYVVSEEEIKMVFRFFCLELNSNSNSNLPNLYM